MARWRKGITRVSAAVALATLGCFPATAQELENDMLRLRFAPDDGRLVEFTDKATGRHHADSARPLPLWSAPLADGSTLAPEAAGVFLWERIDEGKPELKLAWTDFNRTDAPGLRVTVRVSLEPDEPESRWRIRLDGVENLPLRAVHFPRVAIAEQEHETAAVPVWMGERTRQARALLNPESGPRRREWEYPGTLSLQCVTVYRENGPGVYLATDDTGGQRKQFALFGHGGGGLGMDVAHVTAGQMHFYEPPCDALLGAFHGDWFTAAERYRAWARDQRWVVESRARRGLTPDWVRDTGIWVWNRGRSPGVLGPAAALQERAGMPVSVFWHWWHGCSYDTGFPEYLPPREGAEPFRAALAEAHGKDIHALVYMNQRLWCMGTRSWAEEGAERYAVKRPDGTVTPEVYNTFTKAPCASMCMGTAFWRDKYAGLAEAAVRGLGVDGIYMDQACSSLACYDADHGHPLGGGDWWMAGFRMLEGDIRRRCADVRPVALAGEGCGELWLPHLDLMLSLQVSMERYAAPGQWEPIPFFHAVYHDCATFYGNYSSLTRPPYDDLWPAEFAPERPLELLDRKFATQFRLEQARSFVWGQQITVANFLPSHFDERKAEMAFVLELARLRQEAAEYLRDGVMLRPPAFDAPEAEIPISRLSIYAGQQEAVREYSKRVPLVLGAAWQAADGGVAVALANIGEAAARFNLTLARPEYPLPDAGTVYRLMDGQRAPAGTFSGGKAAVEVELPPAGAAVYEFVGETGQN
jgi:hypothetical protein